MYLKLGLLLSKHWKEVLLGVTFLLMVLFMFIFASDQERQNLGSIDGVAQVSPLVSRYEDTIAKYAEKYGVEQYVQLLMAKMMQESGGRGGDPMQASESIGLPPNTIRDPERSIDAGVKEFSEVLAQAEGDIKLTLQAYNFGPGFIPYALDRGGYSKEVAVAFSDMMKERTGWDRYGDVNYVEHVLRYLGGGGISNDDLNEYGFIKPTNTRITSPFGFRVHPVTGRTSLHNGTDFSCNQQHIPIFSVQSGKVVQASPDGTYGNLVIVEHANGLKTYYAHLNEFNVSKGEKIQQGQQVGRCGTTGRSTGLHLHFILEVNGKKVNAEGIVF